MDLVDIDSLLDSLENSNSSGSDKQQQQKPPQSSSSSSSRIYSESPSNRRIKVRSVLSSLNDYVDYDRKQADKSPPESASLVDDHHPTEQQQKSTPSRPCEQTAGCEVNKASSALIDTTAATADISRDSGLADINNGEEAPLPSHKSAVVIEQEEQKSRDSLGSDKAPTSALKDEVHPTPIAVPEQQSTAIDVKKENSITLPTESDPTEVATSQSSTPPSPPVVRSESQSNNNTATDDELAHVTTTTIAVSSAVLSTIPAETEKTETQAANCDQIIAQNVQVTTIEQTKPAAPKEETTASVEEEVEDEEDLEKYLDNLVEEYDKSVETAKELNALPEDDVRTEEHHKEIYKEVEKPATPPPPVPIREDIPALEQKHSEIQSNIENKVPQKVEEEIEPNKIVPEPQSVTSNVDSMEPLEETPQQDQELNMEELRELEKLIEQQEREEQMEMDRQMALKLQEGDDAELVQSLSGGDEPAPIPPPSPARHSIALSASENTSGVSPLEAPRSTSARAAILEDTPEYRYLTNLGKVAPYWVPDSSHDSCMQCDQKFSLMKRRHHCRCCGELVCATCCSFRASLEYMRNQAQPGTSSGSASSVASTSTGPPDWPEARICTKCDALMHRRDELLQLRYLAECGIGEDSGLAEFPIKGVLKKPKAKTTTTGDGAPMAEDEDDEDTTTDNSDSTATPTKTVIFSDGVRPGHDDFADDGQQRTRRRSKAKPAPVAVAVVAKENEPVAAQSPTESEMVARALNSYKAFVTGLKTFYNVQNQSYLPPIKTHLPPMLRNYGGFLPGVELKNDFHSCLELCEFLKEDRRDYLIQKRLHCAVKIIDYRVDANQMDNQCRWCLNVTTNGMSLLGQDEFVILVEMNAEYFTRNASPVDDKRNLKFLLLLLRRLFVHFNKIYTRIYSEISVDLRTKRKMDSQSPDASFLLLDNQVVVAPFQYFNKGYVPALSTTGASKVTEMDTSNGNESDESENSYICDKYTFLKAKNKFIRHMDLQKVTFGTKGDADFYLDFNAVLYVRASLQSTHNVILPDRSCGQMLFGLFVKHTEIPWAKLFPLRLLLRMGAEYRLYPWPLFNALDRKCLYSEFVDNSIIHFLADFRNFSFTLNEIPGLYMHMEHDKVIPSLPDAAKEDNVRVTIYLPKINYKRIEAMINDSSESILSFAGALNPKADGHLVCIQQDGSKTGSVGYSTQSLNIERAELANGEQSKTGLNYFILNGALKSSTGLKAKMSIIEDGVMVQVLPPIMSQVRNALLEMKDFEIKCEESEEKAGGSGEKREGASEVINIVWTGAPVIETIIGLKSEIDEKSLENCSYVNMICDYYKRSEPGKATSQSSRMFGLRSGNSRLEMDCFYLHLHRVVLLEEENYFSLFNEKIIRVAQEAMEDHSEEEVSGGGGASSASAGGTDENANLIKSLNVSNWEVPSINFLIKLASLLGRFVDKALNKHYSKLYDEKLRQIGVRFQFDRDQIVTYEAGSRGTKLPMAFMNELDSQLIPMLHHILELNKKDAPNLLQYNNKNGVGGGVNSLGHNLNAEFLDRINLLQNLQRGITFELVFDIVVDLP